MVQIGELGIGFGILVLVTALFLPFFIGTTGGDATFQGNLSENQVVDLTEKLELEPTNVNSSDAFVTVAVREPETLRENSTDINLTETRSLGLQNDTINVTVDSITNERTIVTAEYSPLYGWDSGARTFFENIQIIFALVGVVMILGSLGSMFST